MINWLGYPVVFPLVSLTPDIVDRDLQYNPQENVGEVIIRTCQEGKYGCVPIWIEISTKQVPKYSNPQGEGVRTSKEKVVPCLVRFTTIEAALRMTPID